MAKKWWADLVADHRAGKTFTAIRIDEVITGSPAEKYHHDHPVESLYMVIILLKLVASKSKT